MRYTDLKNDILEMCLMSSLALPETMGISPAHSAGTAASQSFHKKIAGYKVRGPWRPRDIIL